MILSIQNEDLKKTEKSLQNNLNGMGTRYNDIKDTKHQKSVASNSKLKEDNNALIRLAVLLN